VTAVGVQVDEAVEQARIAFETEVPRLIALVEVDPETIDPWIVTFGVVVGVEVMKMGGVPVTVVTVPAPAGSHGAQDPL
jgi:hypothetical protein